MTEYIQFDKKSPLKAEIKGETKAETIEANKETSAESVQPPPPEPHLAPEAPPIKEVKFFSDPKAVKKKTQGSIIAFQLIFTALFCLLYKLTEALAPELYINISAYLERLFGW